MGGDHSELVTKTRRTRGTPYAAFDRMSSKCGDLGHGMMIAILIGDALNTLTNGTRWQPLSGRATLRQAALYDEKIHDGMVAADRLPSVWSAGYRPDGS